MNKLRINGRQVTTFCLLSLSLQAYSATDLPAVFEGGKVSGNIKAYYNTRDYPERTDTAGFALGGALRAETAGWGESEWGKLGVGFYTAQDMGLNSSDPDKVNGRLGDNLEVLGEAYLVFHVADTDLTLGRQKLSTPLANPGDAFIVPMTYEGYSVENSSIASLKLQAGYINEFKNRNSDEFVDVGIWSTSRYGVTPTSTDGVLYLGATYAPGPFTAQGWYYNFAELFDTYFFQFDYTFMPDSDMKPFVGFQYGIQEEEGDELLGVVDSSLIGIRTGITLAGSKLTLAYNTVDESEDAFKNGAFLAPFNFSTSPLFTNSMLETVENASSGDAVKLTFQRAFGEQVSFKLSYADLEFDTIPDREDIDIDITYKFKGGLKGLSIRNRTTFVESKEESVEQINNRFQIMYVY